MRNVSNITLKDINLKRNLMHFTKINIKLFVDCIIVNYEMNEIEHKLNIIRLF